MSNNTTNSHGSANGSLATFNAKKVKKGSPIINIGVILIALIAIIGFSTIALIRAEKSAALDITCDLTTSLNYGEDTTFVVQPGHTLTTIFQIYTDWYLFQTEKNKWLDVIDDTNSKLVLLGNEWYKNKTPRNNTRYLVFTNNNKWPQMVKVKRTLAQAQLTNN